MRRQKIGSQYLTLGSTDLGAFDLRQFYSAWELYFCSDRKREFARGGEALDGYFGFAEEKALGADSADHKEFFHFFPHGKCPPDLLTPTLTLFRLLSALIAPVCRKLNRLARCLLIDGHDLERSPNLVLRVSYYPPSPLGTGLAAAH